MNEPLLLPVKAGTISAKDKRELRKAGVIVIECEHPSEIRLVKASAELEAGDLLYAAMKGINGHGQARDVFGRTVLQLLDDKRAEKGK